MFIDSHCHLDRVDLKPFNENFADFVMNAKDAGITDMLCVSIDLENYPAMLELVKPFNNIYTSVGVHPCEQEGHDPEVDELIRLAAEPSNVAIGETGLDYFRTEGDMHWQQQRFRRHIQAAREVDKPLIIHTREAREDTINILQEENARQVGGVMHCFTETWEMAQAALEMDFYISFSGIVTFKNATELKEVAKKVPLERMLIETDSPYLAPVPYRGKPNVPQYVSKVAEHIADLRETSVDKIAEQTSQNFKELFKIN
ncbi:MAG: TatD family hydrolase [Gammaproteobacteria bacterium]|jgi:TatD DNase family protein